MKLAYEDLIQHFKAPDIAWTDAYQYAPALPYFVALIKDMYSTIFQLISKHYFSFREKEALRRQERSTLII